MLTYGFDMFLLVSQHLRTPLGPTTFINVVLNVHIHVHVLTCYSDSYQTVFVVWEPLYTCKQM